jgi:hypothetical protein
MRSWLARHLLGVESGNARFRTSRTMWDINTLLSPERFQRLFVTCGVW